MHIGSNAKAHVYLHFPKNVILFLLAFTALILLIACGKRTDSLQPETALYDANTVWHEAATKTRPEIIIIPEVNNRHSNKARVKLLVKTGALQETDEQRGLAHFVEHMAFRGTAAYPEQLLQTRLRELGIQLGRHSNAYVTFDHTAYWLDLNDLARGQLAAALEILGQWAFHIDFTESALQEEIPVIVEEWRRRQLDKDRVQPRMQETFFSGSKHLSRLPILGEKADIEATSIAKLQHFYQQWYHPENMVVVVTGDVEPEHTKQLITQYFSRPEQQPDQQVTGLIPTSYDLQPKVIPDYTALTDPYTPFAALYMGWFYPIPAYSPDSERQALALSLALDVLVERLKAEKLSSNGVVADVRINRNRVSANIRELNMLAVLTKPDFALAYDFLEHELRRLLELGITEHEWQNQVAEWHSFFERLQDSPARLANQAKNFWLYQEPILNQKSHQQRRIALLQQLKAEEGIAVLKTLTEQRNINLVLYPYGSTAPTASELASYRLAAQQKPFAPLVMQKLPQWPALPESSGTISEKQHPEDIIEWQLANGIKAYYRHSAAEPGRVYIRLVAKGGTNLLTDEQVAAAELAAAVINEGGQAGLSSVELKQWRQSLDINTGFYIDFENRSFNLSAPLKTIEQGLLDLHHRLKNYQLDAQLWQFNQTARAQLMESMKDHPHRFWHDAAAKARWQNDIRFRDLTAAEVAAVTLVEGQDFYKQWIKGNPGYHLAIVGDLTAAQARDLVDRYFGSLPESKPQPVGKFSPQPQLGSQLRIAGSGQKHASIELYYYLEKAQLGQSWQTAPDELLTDWLKEQLFDRIRTQSGLVYSISAAINGSSPVHKQLALSISLQTAPEQVDKAIAEVNTLLAEMAQQLPTTQQVHIWQQSRADERLQARQRPSWLLNRIAYSQVMEGSPWERIAPLGAASEPEELSLLLSHFIENSKKIELVWLP